MTPVRYHRLLDRREWTNHTAKLTLIIAEQQESRATTEINRDQPMPLLWT